MAPLPKPNIDFQTSVAGGAEDLSARPHHRAPPYSPPRSPYSAGPPLFSPLSLPHTISSVFLLFAVSCSLFVSSFFINIRSKKRLVLSSSARRFLYSLFTVHFFHSGSGRPFHSFAFLLHVSNKIPQNSFKMLAKTFAAAAFLGLASGKPPGDVCLDIESRVLTTQQRNPTSRSSPSS